MSPNSRPISHAVRLELPARSRYVSARQELRPSKDCSRPGHSNLACSSSRQPVFRETSDSKLSMKALAERLNSVRLKPGLSCNLKAERSCCQGSSEPLSCNQHSPRPPNLGDTETFVQTATVAPGDPLSGCLTSSSRFDPQVYV